jgi:hypothetical protein
MGDMDMELIKDKNLSISLAGQWDFQIDREDVGIKEAWYKKSLNNKIMLPGILQAHGYGDDISLNTPWNQSLYDKLWFLRKNYIKYIEPGKVKVPFLSQPPKHYLGAAWYQREIVIPEEWKGNRVELRLERTQWKTTLWINDNEINSCDSLCISHIFDLGVLKPGKYILTLRIDNSNLMPYRPDAHSISDAVGNSWNGIAGDIELVVSPVVWLEDIRVFPNIHKKSAVFKINIGNVSGKAGQGLLEIGEHELQAEWSGSGGYLEYEMLLGQDAKLWDEFNPFLYKVELILKSDSNWHKKEVTFGLREIKTEGTDFLLNGRKVYFRGTHDGGCFPLTGYPATDVEDWKRIIKTCQSWGLNFIRFHSWCPPEAAFIAADELGFYLQPECGMWNYFIPGGKMEKRLQEETDRIIKAYGNHPSFILFSPSNEPSGDWMNCLTKWVEACREKDKRRLYTAESGWAWKTELHLVEGTDYLYMHRSNEGTLRGKSGWLGGDFGESLVGAKHPVMVHELGQWCSYPDYEIINKFKGYLKPYNYEIFRDSLEEKGMLSRNKAFALASGKLQAEIYKEEIEANLRTPHVKGFELLDLHDYLGQGTALVGLLDAFWEEKGYIKPEKFREFCSETVPLIRLKKRVFTSEELLEATALIAHFGEKELKDVIPYWKITDKEGKLIIMESFKACDIPIGKNIVIGNIRFMLSKMQVPKAYILEVGINETSIKNSWEFWLYAKDKEISKPENVIVTKSLEEAEQHLSEGAKVLYLPRLSELKWNCPPIEVTPVFWNKQMGPTWGRGLGICCDTKHKALENFPTEEHQSWQWVEILKGARAINLDSFPLELQPIVQPIDEWNRNYKLALIFEAKVGSGKLLMCSADLETELYKRPAARQLKESLFNYIDSENFDPKINISFSYIKDLYFDSLVMKKANVKIKTEAQSKKFLVENAFDGDPNTFWLAEENKEGLNYPYEVEMEFEKVIDILGMVYMPRQNHRDHEGEIKKYSIEIKDEYNQWKKVSEGELETSFEPKEIYFSQKVKTNCVKFIAEAGFLAKEVYYWKLDPEIGWLRHKGEYEDNVVSMGELAVISQSIDKKKELNIEYKNIKTATEEMDQ